MVALAGTFDILQVDEVLTLLADHRCTGRLRVRTGAHHLLITLDRGLVVGATASNGATGGGAWERLVEEVCCEALRTRRGTFEVLVEREVSASAGPPLPVSEVLAGARRRAEAWERVERVIPSVEVVPRLAERPRPDPLILEPERWELIVAIDGRHPIASVARRLRMDPLRVCELLVPLVERGAVLLDEPSKQVKMSGSERAPRPKPSRPGSQRSNVRLLPPGRLPADGAGLNADGEQQQEQVLDGVLESLTPEREVPAVAPADEAELVAAVDSA
ncbi:DUF4388 domain-containing protein [Rhabdothermincola sediminis]|uniref:DUF4388 domain-containing protein n=1 Tax=Rhabdothermincola sediminis TaxID=2751370 RepID=UPI001AA0AA58|nr:DUF4388 domain-containing protein [Rhabdothermincola sediminis]